MWLITLIFKNCQLAKKSRLLLDDVMRSLMENKKMMSDDKSFGDNKIVKLGEQGYKKMSINLVEDFNQEM